MSKPDVQSAMSSYILNHYKDLEIVGKEKLDEVTRALATIQDLEYYGSGEYNALFDLYGNIKDNNGIKENEHFCTICKVIVSSDSENSPIIKNEDKLFLNRKN